MEIKEQKDYDAIERLLEGKRLKRIEELKAQNIYTYNNKEYIKLDKLSHHYAGKPQENYKNFYFDDEPVSEYSNKLAKQTRLLDFRVIERSNGLYRTSIDELYYYKDRVFASFYHSWESATPGEDNFNRHSDRVSPQTVEVLENNVLLGIPHTGSLYTHSNEVYIDKELPFVDAPSRKSKTLNNLTKFHDCEIFKDSKDRMVIKANKNSEPYTIHVESDSLDKIVFDLPCSIHVIDSEYEDYWITKELRVLDGKCEIKELPEDKSISLNVGSNFKLINSNIPVSLNKVKYKEIDIQR